TQSVPSLSNAATRSAGSMYAAPGVVAAWTKSRIACLAGPALQLVSTSDIACANVNAPRRGRRHPKGMTWARSPPIACRRVKQHVMTLGAGFGGLELATRLSETLQDAVRVTLLDRNDGFVFGYSKLDVMLGRQSAAEVRLPYREFVKEGVEFRQETV